MEQSLSPDVGKLLRDLQPEQTFNAVRKEAARRLGQLSASDLRVVNALIAAMESDPSSLVRKQAAESLCAPAHQEILQQHPDLMNKVLDIQKAQQDLSAIPKAMPSAEQRVTGKITASPGPAVAPEIGLDELAALSCMGRLQKSQQMTHETWHASLRSAFLSSERGGETTVRGPLLCEGPHLVPKKSVNTSEAFGGLCHEQELITTG